MKPKLICCSTSPRRDLNFLLKAAVLPCHVLVSLPSKYPDNLSIDSDCSASNELSAEFCNFFKKKWRGRVDRQAPNGGIVDRILRKVGLRKQPVVVDHRDSEEELRQVLRMDDNRALNGVNRKVFADDLANFAKNNAEWLKGAEARKFAIELTRQDTCRENHQRFNFFLAMLPTRVQKEYLNAVSQKSRGLRRSSISGPNDNAHEWIRAIQERDQRNIFVTQSMPHAPLRNVAPGSFREQGMLESILLISNEAERMKLFRNFSKNHRPWINSFAFENYLLKCANDSNDPTYSKFRTLLRFREDLVAEFNEFEEGFAKLRSGFANFNNRVGGMRELNQLQRNSSRWLDTAIAKAPVFEELANGNIEFFESICGIEPKFLQQPQIVFALLHGLSLAPMDGAIARAACKILILMNQYNPKAFTEVLQSEQLVNFNVKENRGQSVLAIAALAIPCDWNMRKRLREYVNKNQE